MRAHVAQESGGWRSVFLRLSDKMSHSWTAGRFKLRGAETKNKRSILARHMHPLCCTAAALFRRKNKTKLQLVPAPASPCQPLQTPSPFFCLHNFYSPSCSYLQGVARRLQSACHYRSDSTMPFQRQTVGEMGRLGEWMNSRSGREEKNKC